MVEKITGLNSLPNGRTWKLPASGDYDKLIAKYGKLGDNITKSSNNDFGDMLSYIYANAKRNGGLGIKEAAKDVSALVDSVPVKELSVSSLNVAIEHGDTPNARAIAGKMPSGELAKYSGDDLSVVAVRNKRAEKIDLTGAVQDTMPKPVTTEKQRTV